MHRTRTWTGVALLAIAVVVVTSCSPQTTKSRRPRVSPAPTLTAPPKGGPTTVPAAISRPPASAPAAAPKPSPAPIFSDFAKYVENQGFIPASSANEPSGNFRQICEFSHLGYNDPIVNPGQPGAAHLHMFFGNTMTNASSTYASLRATGDGTCNGGPLNRTGYWMPAVHNARGDVVVPDYFALYYKANIGSGPSYQDAIRSVRTYPPGLKMLAGTVMGDAAPSTRFDWYCDTTQNKSQRIPNCPTGERVGVVLQFPTCWNGRDLDSPNHRDHMAYLEYGATSRAACPSSHPVLLPEFTLGAWFTHDGDSRNWYLSSDRMPGMTYANGSSFHSDWFGAWDPTIEDRFVRTCINGMRNCQDGQLGDGTRLKAAPDYKGPRVVATPPKP